MEQAEQKQKELTSKKQKTNKLTTKTIKEEPKYDETSKQVKSYQPHERKKMFNKTINSAKTAESQDQKSKSILDSLNPIQQTLNGLRSDSGFERATTIAKTVGKIFGVGN